MFVPKLATTLRGYTRQDATADIVAGLIVGVVALPLCIAFAIASGVPPEYGLYTGIIGGFLISLLGGSRVQIGGPTGAFVVIVYGVVQQYGVDGLAIATILAGGLLVALGFAKLGGAIKFIPFPVTTGFTAGIAVLIASNEVDDLLGLSIASVPSEFVPKWNSFLTHLETINPHALAVSGVALLTLIVWPRISRRIPAPFIALLAGGLLVPLFGLEVETVGSRFGDVSVGLPSFRLPHVDFATVGALVAPAFAIAMLGGIESLLSAVVADGMIGGKHRSNMELVAQGVANIVTPLFGGIPATGAIARTATNIKNGGRTPVAGIVHAFTLLAIGLFLGRWVAYIPLAALAAILLVVAYRMSEWRTFKAELRAPRSDVIVLLSTFALTVLVDLTVAIEVGMVLAAFLFMRRMAEVVNVSVVTREFEEDGDEADPNAVGRRVIPKGVEVYEINGPFFFGAAEKFKETMGAIAKPPRVLILRMRNVPAIDSTGLNALRDLVRRSRKDRTLILLSDVHAQPMIALGRSDLLDEIGEESIYGNLDDALNRARTLLGLAPIEAPGFAPTVARERAEGASAGR